MTEKTKTWGGKAQKPKTGKVIIDTNKHGIRRERYADWKPKKNYGDK